MSEIDTKLQEPPPEHCPGTESKDAGNASACQGIFIDLICKIFAFSNPIKVI